MKRWRTEVIDRELLEGIDEANALTPASQTIDVASFVIEAPRRKRRLWLALGLCGLLLLAAVKWGHPLVVMATLLWAPFADFDLHVATTGTDNAACGSALAPCATLNQARINIQARTLNVAMTVDQIVQIEPGDYAGVNFDDRDSGSNGHFVVYQARAGIGTVRILGGNVIANAGCSVFSGSIYKCPITTPFYTMYEDGVRMILARTPNKTSPIDYPEQQGPYFTAQNNGSSHTAWQYSAGDFDPSAWTHCDEQSLVAISGGSAFWFSDIQPISSINTGTHVMTLANPTRYYAYDATVGSPTGSRYFVQGCREQIDADKEFYVDRSGLFVYFQPTGGSLAGHEYIYPTTQDAIRMVGRSTSTPVTGIKLKNLTVQASDFGDHWRYGTWGWNAPLQPFPPGTSTGSDWDPNAGAGHVVKSFSVTATDNATLHHALVYLQNVSGPVFDGVHLLDGGYSNLYGYLNVTGVTVTNSWIERAGYDAIAMEGGYPREGDVNNGHTVTNTLMERTGELVAHGRCVDFMQSRNNAVNHFECGRTPREGVFITATCGLSDYDTACYDDANVIANGFVHDCMKNSSDGGCIYSASLLPAQQATPPYKTNTYQQLVLDRSNTNPYAPAFAAHGLYWDDGSVGAVGTNIAISNAAIAYHATTETVTTTNVQGATSFSDGPMDYANDGINWSTWAYATAWRLANGLSDDFESGLGGWTNGQGTGHLSTTQSHSATHAFVTDADGVVIYKQLDSARRMKATFWFYDDTAQTNMESFACADETTYTATWNVAAHRCLGVTKSRNAGFYAKLVDGVYTITSVARATGWHKFDFDYSSNAGVVLSVDNVSQGLIGGVRQFNVLSMGDYVIDGLVGTSYFDDVSVS